MAVQHILVDYMNYISGSITLQEYIDRLCNQVENNQVKSFLHNFLESTHAINEHFAIANQEMSIRYPVYANNIQVYYFYVRKIPALHHYCIYIVIPAGHPLNGHSYDDVPDATYCSPDSEDPTRWIFGWDYMHFEYCTPGILHFLISNAPDELLAKKIISVETLMNDIHSKIDYLCAI